MVDDDPTVLKMLQAQVATMGVSVHGFDSAKQFLAAYQPTPCECLICDLRMPEIDGLELQRRLKTIDSILPIIFLTGFAEVGIAVNAMRDGAFDFLEKPFGMHALLIKIQAALDSNRMQFVKWGEKRDSEERLALLTSREKSVVLAVTEGKSSREISELLGISIRTVENYRARIMEKLHVASTVDLVKLFL